MASLHIATALRTVFVSYMIVVVVRNTVTLAVALLPTLARVCCQVHSSKPRLLGSSCLPCCAACGVIVKVLRRLSQSGEHSWRQLQMKPVHH